MGWIKRSLSQIKRVPWGARSSPLTYRSKNLLAAAPSATSTRSMHLYTYTSSHQPSANTYVTRTERETCLL